MILPSSTSRKRELAIGTALKQFNVDPQPIATDRVTNAFNNLRNCVFTKNDDPENVRYNVRKFMRSILRIAVIL